jgi:hypothetical protein
MTKIIQFPKSSVSPIPETKSKQVEPVAINERKGLSFFAGLIKIIWVPTVLIWPLIKWIISIDVLFQFVRMFYLWNTPGAYPGWTFAIHFGILTTLTWFVSIYNPMQDAPKKAHFSG